MSDAEEPEMSGEVRHIEQGIILTELIQIEPHDTITRHHDVLCRKIAMGQPGHPLSEGAAALPDADQEIGEEALDRKSTRLNSSHRHTSHAVFFLQKINFTKHAP